MLSRTARAEDGRVDEVRACLAAGLAAADRRILLAWLCLASLASRSEGYPVLARLGSADVSVQDALFGLLIAASLPLGLAWVRGNRLIAVAMGVFCALLTVAALRSPVGEQAIVAVGKYLVFVLAGCAIALNIRRARNPAAFTWALVAATVLNLGVAVGQSFSGAGIAGPMTARTGGLLGLESAAALAVVTMVWCLARVSRAVRQERKASIAGILAALLLLLMAKSVLAVAGLLALAVVGAAISSPAAFRAVAVGTAIVAVLLVTVGRSADVRSAIIGTAVPAVGLPGVGPGVPPQVAPRYAVRQPERVTGGSFVHRVALGYVGARIALDSPLLGRGWQSTNSRDFLQQGPYDGYMTDRFPDLDPQLFVSSLPQGPHNGYIQLVAEAGWAAAVALVVALVSALVAGLVASRRATAESWHNAVGASWVTLVAIFLMSSSLFGGQLESAILGAGIVLATPAAGLAVVSARAWIAAAVVVVLATTAVAAGLFLPTSDAQGQPIARVRALTEQGRGEEVFRRGAVPRNAQIVLDNGLLQASLGDRSLTLVARTVATRVPTVLTIDPATRIAREVITHREADIVSIEGRDADDRPIIKLALRRGIPGAFVQLARGTSLRAEGGGALLRNADLGESTFPTQRAQQTRSLRGQNNAALVPSSANTVIAFVSDPAPRPLTAADGTRFLVGILPRTPTTAGAAPTRGSYLEIARGRGEPTRIVRESGLAQRRPALAVPYLLDDRDNSGLAELLGFNAAYGRRLEPLP